MDVNNNKTNHSLFSARMAADLAVTNGGTMINAEGVKSEKGYIRESIPMDRFLRKQRGCNMKVWLYYAASFKSMVSVSMVYPRLWIYVANTDVLA